MKIRILNGDVHLLDLQTRMPFKYGIATLTRAPHAFVRVRAEVDGRSAAGIAADLLPPRWFTKDPRESVESEIRGMLRVIERAVEGAEGLEGPSGFEVWRALYRAQASWGKREGLPPLLSNFGVSLVERALIEALGRAAGKPLWRLLREDLLGIRLDAVHPELEGLSPADLLPAKPRERLLARHTVGLADPLVDSEIPPPEKLADGLPQSLAACIRAYGLRHFKVKVAGDPERDLPRLVHVAEVIEAHAPRGFALSLDGNEQFRSLDAFRAFWERASAVPRLREFLARLLFVEQPLHRDVALLPEVGTHLAAWPAAPPLIIDESDGALESLPEALRLGYAGTSHKNCKGVFKGILNACLLARRRRDGAARPPILSGEDLACVGPVALLQDLAACAALGIESVERNGHHYFAGLSMFPPAVQSEVLRAHGDLYRRSPAGWPALAIEAGALELGSVNAAPFGVGFELGVEAFLPAPAWKERFFGKGKS